MSLVIPTSRLAAVVSIDKEAQAMFAWPPILSLGEVKSLRYLDVSLHTAYHAGNHGKRSPAWY